MTLFDIRQEQIDDLDLAMFGKGLQRQRWICLFIPKNPWDEINWCQVATCFEAPFWVSLGTFHRRGRWFLGMKGLLQDAKMCVCVYVCVCVRCLLLFSNAVVGGSLLDTLDFYDFFNGLPGL